MNASIHSNAVLARVRSDDQREQLTRILKVDPLRNRAAALDVQSSNAFPEWLLISELEADLANGELRGLVTDPFCRTQREEELSEASKRVRDRRWSVIVELVQDPGDAILDAGLRGRYVAEAADRHRVSRSDIYRWLRSYWRWGQTRNALLPSFDRCGAPGRVREPGLKKRGRPSCLSIRDPDKAGVNVTAATRSYFEKGVKMFHKTPERSSLPSTYQRILQTFFFVGKELHPDGRLESVLPEAHELPTFDQFKDWYFRTYKGPNQASLLKSRRGERGYNLKNRPLLGSWRGSVPGPASVFQIDSTPADIHLVSRVDRRIIGRPTVYFVIDVFSWLIAGYSVSLEGSSWLGMALALDNAFSDKVAWCKRYGIDIADAEWPCRHVPEELVGDRGELTSEHANQLAIAFPTIVKNDPAYRPDWKPHVESAFAQVGRDLLKWLPGHAKNARTRGEYDSRLDAALDLQAFNQLLIAFILWHNNTRYLEEQLPYSVRSEYGVDPYPAEIWRFGIEHRTGEPFLPDSRVVRANLLPHAIASVTPKGIGVNGLHYIGPTAIAEGWLAREPGKRYREVDVGIDPRNVSKIFLRLNRGREVEECSLHDRDRAWSDYTLAEVQAARREMRADATLAKTHRNQLTARYQARRDAIIEQATEGRVDPTRSRESKAGRLADVRQNRAIERRLEARDGAWTKTDDRPADEPHPPDDEYLPAPSFFARIAREQAENSPLLSSGGKE